MADKGAKAMRETDKKNAQANKKGAKGAVASGKGQEKSGVKKAAPKKKAKKA